ncbi:MAG: acyltransferase family protein [Acidimicrobiales bacterium]|jgi:peptidoglycan/LPS O-acetylase OafA/YrhL|nr:acyltransferase family protein [Acidimicrobiales bacterium]
MEGDGQRPHLAHMPALDGLRGVAVAGVLAFHLGRLTGGYLGVDAFFVLSGFLITSLLLAEHATAGTIHLAAFWARRARRLLPALLVVLVAVAFAATVWVAARDLGRVRDDGLATLFYIANWHSISAGHGYWASFETPSLLQHTWSLAIEEQFYVVWPLVVVAVLRIGRGSLRVLLAVTAALAATSAAAMVFLHHRGGDPSRVYYGTDTRVAAILMGAALAIVLARRGPVRSARARAGVEVAALLAVAGVAFAWATVGGQTNGLYEGGLALCGLAVVAVIAAAAHPSPGPVAWALSVRPLQWLGRISYGVYLWHWPVFVLMTPERTHLSSGLPVDVARVAVTLAVSVLSYRLIETPIRRGSLAGWRSWAATPAAAGAVVVALIATTAGAEPAVSIASAVASAAGRTGAVVPAPPAAANPAAATTLAPASTPGPVQPRRLMIAGDSVAMTVGVGMGKVASEFGIDAVLNRGFLGCGVARGSGRIKLATKQVTQGQECLSWPTRWAADLTTFVPDVTVLLVGGWDTTEIQHDGVWGHACQPEFDAWYEGQVRNAVAVLGARGAPVVILDAPYLNGGILVSGQAEAARRIDCVNAIYRRVATTTPGAALVGLAMHVCPSGPTSCVQRVDGVVLRPDGIHYDGPAGPLIARWLIPEVFKAAAGVN